MRIGLLGMGTIGSGVYEIVAKRADMEIARVLDLRPIPGLGGKLTRRTSSWCARCAPARAWSRPTS